MLSLVVSVTGSLFIDRFGRRPLFLVSTVGIVLSYMGWTIISAQYERTQDLARFGYPQIAFIWLYSVGYQIAWTGVMAAYALEIIPYSLRAKAGVISGLCVKSLSVLGRYVGLGFAGTRGDNADFLGLAIPIPSRGTTLQQLVMLGVLPCSIRYVYPNSHAAACVLVT